ncbi:MAG TPA: hypothetical protein VGJ33_13465 [Candidatus Angelobacter sp.]
MDAAGAAKVIRAAKLLCALTFLVAGLLCFSAYAQSDQETEAKQLFQNERWAELVQLLAHAPRPSAETNYYYGIALAHLERWDEAEKALLAGQQLAPTDKRFPIELAGIAFKKKNYLLAKSYLNSALRLDSSDTYVNEFLATIYFLERNQQAALKYWNRTGKPEIVEIRDEPALRVRPALLDHALAFAPASRLTLDELLASDARLHALDIFSSYKIDLAARPDGKFDVVLHAQEMNGFGNSKLQALFRVFSSIFYQEVTPEYYNLHGSGVNIISLFRWDPDKRRIYAGLSGPLSGDPKWHYRLATDLRNENWTVQTSFTGPSTVLGALNLRRESLSAEIMRLVGARWKWSTGVEISHRDFRNVLPGVFLTPELLSKGYQIKQTAQLDYELWRWPERRLTISSSARSQAGRVWSEPGESFVKLQGSIDAHWLPRAIGDDYETRWRIRAGKTFGQAPFDELFMLGVQRDNYLPLRAHSGTRHGQFGSAPLGRNYFLSNFESDKHVYATGIVTIKLGPFLDTGKILDSTFISPADPHKWLFDTGPQAKLKVLGVGVVLLYGKDLRTGNNVFYTDVEW